MIKLTTAGESHGKALLAIVEGVPANLPLTKEYIDRQLARRQLGFGRGARMKIEKDSAEILSGLRGGLTIGSPIAFLIQNKDYENWKQVMDQEKHGAEPLTAPRPGHADLAGALKTGQKDLRNILERSSARETAARVAGASVARKLLEELGIKVMSAVTSLGGVVSGKELSAANAAQIDDNPVRMADDATSKKAVQKIEEASEKGETLGGTFRVMALGLPPGLGGYATADERLDGLLAKAIVSVPAVKGVSFGKGFELGKINGSAAHDDIYFDKGYYRKTNRAGGLEGGMTNGEPLVIDAVMKPIPTTGQPMNTVDMESKEKAEAFKERSDVTAVPSASVVAESMVCMVIANACLKKFGTDNIFDIKENFKSYIRRL